MYARNTHTSKRRNGQCALRSRETLGAHSGPQSDPPLPVCPSLLLLLLFLQSLITLC